MSADLSDDIYKTFVVRLGVLCNTLLLNSVFTLINIRIAFKVQIILFAGTNKVLSNLIT